MPKSNIVVGNGTGEVTPSIAIVIPGNGPLVKAVPGIPSSSVSSNARLLAPPGNAVSDQSHDMDWLMFTPQS